jgi:hypothetical protein
VWIVWNMQPHHSCKTRVSWNMVLAVSVLNTHECTGDGIDQPIL